jgi:hypothetical protein
MGIVYLLVGINMVLKTRLHHIENGHKSTSALDFGWASRSAPFCAFLRCSAQKQGAFCAPFCLFLVLLLYKLGFHRSAVS